MNLDLMIKQWDSAWGKVMERTSETPRIEIGTRTFSKSWIVRDGDAEIATVTMSVTALHEFQEDHVRELLKNIAEGKEVKDMDEKQSGPINHDTEWTNAIYACLYGITNALPKDSVPTREAAETVRLLAEAAARLTFG